LDGLLVVNPSLRKYGRVADIISYQTELLKEYKSAFQEFKSSGKFTPEEITYMGELYGNLFNRSLQNLDELMMVLTDSKLRMSDDERLTAIDRIYGEMQDKLSFLRTFNGRTKLLEQQRTKARQNAAEMKKLYGVPN
jgi:excinuclease UvrABC helicase subunit UvrB